MPVSSCPPVDVLQKLLTEVPNGGDGEALLAHVDGCARCQARLEQWTTARDAFGSTRSLPGDTEAWCLPRTEFLDGLRESPSPWTMAITNGDQDSGLSSYWLGKQRHSEASRCPVVPGYEIQGELGRGAMGIVYKARHKKLGRLVALKMILRGPQAGPDLLARFRREAEAIARLQHPNVIQIYDLGEQDGQPFFAMEYASGGSLARQLDGTPQPPRQAAELVEILARAVQAAHVQGIIHRDLKPANILLQRRFTAEDAEERRGKAESSLPLRFAASSAVNDYVPKIADFGLAKIMSGEQHEGAVDGPLSAASQSGAIIGSPSYMAPEQAQNRRTTVGPAADVYALGAILYELLTGRPPFKAATPLDTVLQVLHDEPLPPRRLQANVPRDLETICLTCLHKETSHRYAGAGGLADDLERFLKGESIRAQPTPWWRRAAQWARRRPALAALVTVLTLAAGSLLGGGLWYNARLQQEVQQRAVKEAEALEQQRLALAHYREARAAIRQMLVRLEDKQLAKVPRLLGLRLQQLEDALAFYQHILQERDALDAAVCLDTAQAYLQAAKIEQLLGKPIGQAHAEQAEHLLRALAAENPTNAEYQVELAACLNLLTMFDQVAGNRFSQAEARSREAIGRCETVVQTQPEAAACLYELADAHRLLGNLYFGANRLKQAEQEYLAARDLGERLVRTHPDDPKYRNALAEFCSRLAHVTSGEQAEEHFRRGEALFQRLIQEYPDEPSYSLRLGGLYCNWGQLRLESSPVAALDLLARGIGILEPVHQREPQYGQVCAVLLNLHGVRAYALQNLGRYADAVRDWDEVVNLAEGAHRLRCRAERATAMARADQHARAVAEARAVAGDKDSPPVALLFAAFACSLSINAVRGDEGLTPAERDRLVEEYGAAAIQILRKAQAAGVFRDKHLVNSYLRDPHSELGAIQSRKDFQQLRAEVEGP